MWSLSHQLTWLFTQVLVLQLKSSCLHSNHFANWPISLDLFLLLSFFYNYLVSHGIMSPRFIHVVACLRTYFLLNFESHLILIWVTHAFSPPENRMWLSLKQEGSCSTFWLLCLRPFLGFSEPPPHLQREKSRERRKPLMKWLNIFN